MYGNNSIWQDIKLHFKHGGMVNRLIMVNLAVFLAVNMLYVVGFLFQAPDLVEQVLAFLKVPSSLKSLAFKPWTVMTYMFLHQGFLHILFNMLWLYWFGRILREYLGDRKILPLYFYGGLAGAAAYILFYNIFPAFASSVQHSTMLGASAGVMAVVVGTATLLPNNIIRLVFIGDVQLKWIAAFSVILDAVMIGGYGNSGGHIAHLGGAFLGFLFIKNLQNGKDWSLGFNKLVDRFTGTYERKQRPGPKIVYKNEGKMRSSRRKKEPVYTEDKQERLDSILDKISDSGYESLSQEEKEFLFKASKED